MGPVDVPDDRHRPVTYPALDVDETIRRAGLIPHVYDLESKGFTVVEDAVTPAEVDVLTDGLLALAGQDDGGTDPLAIDRYTDRTQEVVLLLTRGGRPFEQLVLHPKALSLVTYLLGRSCLVSSVTGYVKGPGSTTLGVHSDTAYVPDPLPPYAQVANVNYCLTDYTPEGGCLTVVPGSHRYCHRPRDGAGVADAVPVVAPAGSAIVFHGNTWHGALPRTLPGLRLTVSTLYCRMYVRPQERYDELVDAEAMARNPPRFRVLVGHDLPTSWRSPEDAGRIVRLRRSYAPTYYRTRSQLG